MTGSWISYTIRSAFLPSRGNYGDRSRFCNLDGDYTSKGLCCGKSLSDSGSRISSLPLSFIGEHSNPQVASIVVNRDYSTIGFVEVTLSASLFESGNQKRNHKGLPNHWSKIADFGNFGRGFHKQTHRSGISRLARVSNHNFRPYPLHSRYRSLCPLWPNMSDEDVASKVSLISSISLAGRSRRLS